MGWKNTVAAVVAFAVLFLTCSPASCVEVCRACDTSICIASMTSHPASPASTDGKVMPSGHCAHVRAMTASPDPGAHMISLASDHMSGCAGSLLCEPTPPREANAQPARFLDPAAPLLLPITLPLDLSSMTGLQSPRVPLPPQAFRQALFALRFTRLRV